MTGFSARQMLDAIRRENSPSDVGNRLVSLIAAGKASLQVLAAIAGEQGRVIESDLRSLLLLSARSVDAPLTSAFFQTLAHGEGIARERLVDYAAACGLDSTARRTYEPLAGCQAYSSYVAWLALNGEPTSVVLAMVVNFAEWGGYCAVIAQALREHYGFDDTGCEFFDFFATPSPGLTEQAVSAVQNVMDAGHSVHTAREYARLLRGYEAMFWETLAATRI